LSYNLNNLPEPMPIFKSIYSLGVNLEEMYRVFNMGVGFAIITTPDNVEKTLKIVEKYYPAQEIGNVVADGKGRVKLKTMEGSWIEL